ncbi:hypothetical protein [Nostoc favosum]|uniref:hypothetical protein n=1 Tax=Nostoc favosum TaxID=2907819 RepID=UPI0034D97264
MHYLVRSVTPGTFSWPGAEVRLQYAPEEFGRTAESTLISSSRTFDCDRLIRKSTPRNCPRTKRFIH